MTSAGADALIERMVEMCSADDRIVAAFLGGSRARGLADDYSDVDISVIVANDAYADLIAGKAAFVQRLGKALFVEDFGNEHMAFVIFADGNDLELQVFSRSDIPTIRSGPHRVLLDKEGVLAGREFPLPELDREVHMAELRNILFWFWHDVGHFTTAVGRGQLWWAAGQLEQLRSYCVNLARIAQGVEFEDEPYWKLDVETSTDALEELRSTFVPIDRKAMLKAGRDVVAFFRRKAPVVAQAHGLIYPAELDALVSGHLDRVPESLENP